MRLTPPSLVHLLLSIAGAAAAAATTTAALEGAARNGFGCGHRSLGRERERGREAAREGTERARLCKNGKIALIAKIGSMRRRDDEMPLPLALRSPSPRSTEFISEQAIGRTTNKLHIHVTTFSPRPSARTEKPRGPLTAVNVFRPFSWNLVQPVSCR